VEANFWLPVENLLRPQQLHLLVELVEFKICIKRCVFEQQRRDSSGVGLDMSSLQLLALDNLIDKTSRAIKD
jgi:hypothetical protein